MQRSILNHGFLFFLAFAACGGHDHDEENPNVEACEHLGMAGTNVTPASSASGTLPAIKDDHNAYKLSLTGSTPGYVSFAATQAGTYLLFTDAAATVKVTTSAGVEVPASATASSIDECTTVKGRYEIPLQVGSYVLSFTAASPQVGVIIERQP